MQQLFPRVVAIFLLLMVCAGAWAEDYVFMNSGYILGQSTTPTTDFVPNASIYSGTSGSTFRNANEYYILYDNGLKFDNGKGSNFTIDNNRLRYSDYYLRYSGTNNAWRIDNTNYNRATAYTVTKTTLDAGTISNFTISGDTYISTTGTTNYTHTNATVDAACTQYKFNNLTYYSTDPANAASTTRPQTEVTSGYTWSLSGNGSYATVNTSNGKITVSSIPDDDVVMTLTCTVNGKSATKQITLTKTPPVAAGYVIYDGNGHYFGGTSTTAITSFNPKTCLWQGSNGGKWQNASNYYLRMDRYNYTLTTSQSDATNLNLLGTEAGTTGQKIYDAYSDNRFYFLKYSNNAWNKGDRQSSATTDETNTNIVFAVTKREVSAKSTDPAISGDTEINALGENSSFNITTPAAKQDAYTDYIFYNGTSHFIDGNGNLVTEAPQETFTNTWSLEDENGNAISSEYASIDKNGVITYKKSFDVDTDVTVKLTATGTKDNTLVLTTQQKVTFKVLPKFYLTITTETDGNGSITTEPSTLPTVAYGATASSTEGKASVTFTATPKTGYAFVKWTDAGGKELGTDATLTKEFTSDKKDSSTPATYTVKANFKALPKFYYNVVANVTTKYADGSEDEGKNVAGGSVRGAGPGVAYGEALASESATASVKLTATASKGYAFKGWYSTSDATGTPLSTDPEYTLSITTDKTSDTEPEAKTLYAHFEEFPIFYAKVNIVCKEWMYASGSSSGSFASESKGCAVKTSPALTSEGLVALHATSMSQESAETSIELTALPSEEFGFRGWGKQGAGVIDATAIDDLQNSYSSTRRNDNYKVTATAKSRDAAQSQTATTIYAYFKELPLLYFAAEADVLPCVTGEDANKNPITEPNPGTAKAEPTTKTGHATSFTDLKGTTTVLYTAEAKENFKFGGWYKKNDDDTYSPVSTYNPYSAPITSTSVNESAPTTTKLYAKFLCSMETIAAQDIILDTESDGWLDIKITPEDAWAGYEITAENNALIFVDNSGHCMTNTKTGSTTITIQGIKVDGSKPESLKKVINATVKIKCFTPEIIFLPHESDEGFTAEVTLTTQKVKVPGSDKEEDKIMPDIYYSFDEGDTKNWTKYDESSKPSIRAGQKIYVKSMVDGQEANYSESAIGEEIYQKPKVAAPTVVITKDGVTFSSETPGPITYYYKVYDNQGGDDPTTESGGYTATWTTGGAVITTIPNEKWIKVIGTKEAYDNSDVTEKQYIYASGVHDNTVYLNDYEDHTWTYYSGVDAGVDGGNYNTNYAGKIYSPDPRNVKITYYGNGKLADLSTAVTGVKVGIDAAANTFVYYKTIENKSGYKYITIPNPFSVRPKIETNYYGFVSWRVKSVTGGTITGKAVGSTINAETEITFVPTSTYTTNCTSMEVELEAVWDVAEVSTNGSFSKGYNSVERNFYIVSNSTNNNLPIVNTRCTYTSFYPNGTTNGTTSATMNNRNTRRGNFTCTADSKVEYLILAYDNNGTINADAHNLTIGRGCSPASGTSSNQLYGMSNKNVESPKFHLRVESGSYNYMSFYGGYYTNNGGDGGNSSTISGSEANLKVTMGSDYDRAAATNTNLTMKYAMTFGRSCSFSSRSNRNNLHTLDLTLKSGKLGTAFFMEDTNTANYLQGGAGYGHYMSSGGSQTNVGCRNILIQGGEFCTIGSGIDAYNNGGNNNDTYDDSNKGRLAFNVRMTGGIVHGNIYGGAAKSPAGGNRVMIVTGGQVKGWFAAGCNGTDSDGGQTYGTSWVYIGGTGRIDSEGSTKKLGYASGGNVYAAGAGRQNATTCGEMTFGSNLVIADDSYIERGAYGGGNYGYAKTSTNIYITGGKNKGDTDTNANNAKGGVFAGANQQDGPEVKIWMTGGKMLGGVYGGCNTKGTISGNVTMQINGGQVGTEKTPASIHGGGYGTDTQVTGNVDITLGNTNVNPEENPGVTVYGNVYGGSALGKVNGTNNATATNNRHTYVTVNSGNVLPEKYPAAAGAYKYGNVFGGGMGELQNGQPKEGEGTIDGQIKVTVNRTSPLPENSNQKYSIRGVFGGGDAAPYNGTPEVVVNTCDNSIEYVYGGGNAAKVYGTNVWVHGGDSIGNVFGGGYGANVEGDVLLNIDGGRILNVFGGNNASGEVTGDITINVNQNGYKNATCPIDIDYLYGGGNRADSKTAQMHIFYADRIGYVFGGARAANMTGDINLNIVAGNIDNVFGGNDAGGNINGKIGVTVNWYDDKEDKSVVFTDKNGATIKTYPAVKFTRTNNSIGNVFGGGNIAAYGRTTHADSTTVKVLNADVSGSIFGGGKGKPAFINGNTNVTIGDWNPNHYVYVKGDVYGGGDQAAVYGTSVGGATPGSMVTINDCATVIEGDVYGGGNASQTGSDAQNARTYVTVWGGNINRIFGGGHGYPENPPVASDIYGSTYVNVFGGTMQGVFGGSNSVGNISVSSNVVLDERICETDTYGDNCFATDACQLQLQEVYGAGNQAKMDGEPNLTILCVSELGEIYGGARAADINRDIVLNISSGKYRKVFGGNNISGKINGTITVNVDETGCHPIVIGELYGGGNQARYEAPEGKESPVVNVISCTSIGTVFGGGYGEGALVVGSPYVHIDMVEGDWSNRIKPNTTDHPWDNKLGSIGTIFGGGNAANVEGGTNVNIGTKKDIKRTNGEELPVQGVNIKGNVYGGGNQADVTGKTHVQVGPTPTTN